MLIQTAFLTVKKLAKVSNVTNEESIEKISEFMKDLHKFEARLSLVESLEINYSDKKGKKLDENIVLSSKEEILDYILNLKERTISFKVIFKNKGYYIYNPNGSRSYTSNSNSTVTNFLLKYI